MSANWFQVDWKLERGCSYRIAAVVTSGEGELVCAVLAMGHTLQHEKRTRVERAEALIAHPEER